MTSEQEKLIRIKALHSAAKEKILESEGMNWNDYKELKAIVEKQMFDAGLERVEGEQGTLDLLKTPRSITKASEAKFYGYHITYHKGSRK